VYEVTALIGEGGMGEVYRAKDTKLGRDVALKILPASFTNDLERAARFRREAQVLASLNHPNIGAIYGFEDADGVHALVLELVDGPTLADRIAQWPMPIEEALPIAKQIAEALEAAHEQGIVHRDLKPANVKVRADGTVKVLDFGLAKLAESTAVAGTGTLTQSPTITTPAMTAAGIILGTAAYMAPEQARGKTVDKRADIWAFGCVLFEMLTGRRAFDGDDISTTLAAVLKTESDWQLLPPTTPAGLRRLLVRCLKKDPKDRLQAIGDARVEIGDLLSSGVDDVGPTAATPARGPRRLRRAAATLTLIAAGGVGALASWAVLPRPSVTQAEPVRFTMAFPGLQAFGGVPFALSPDGRHLVYSAVSAGSGGSTLMLRAMDQIDAAAMKGLSNPTRPFFSPDGRWVGYFEGPAGMKKVSVTGGPPISVCRTNGSPTGATWGPDDTIIFGTGTSFGGGLFAVPAGGGEPRALTRPDVAHGERLHMSPSELPNGRGVLFTILPATNEADAALVAVLDLRTGKYKAVIRGGSNAVYVDGGYVVYAAAGALRAVRFDPDRLEVTGDSVPVVDHVMTTLAWRSMPSLERAHSCMRPVQGRRASTLRGARLHGSIGADMKKRSRSRRARTFGHVFHPTARKWRSTRAIRIKTSGFSTWHATRSLALRLIPQLTAFHSGRPTASKSSLNPVATAACSTCFASPRTTPASPSR
jgi:serine/threonine-protein kinase